MYGAHHVCKLIQIKKQANIILVLIELEFDGCACWLDASVYRSVSGEGVSWGEVNPHLYATLQTMLFFNIYLSPFQLTNYSNKLKTYLQLDHAHLKFQNTFSYSL